MARLTDREIDLIARARNESSAALVDLDTVILRARRMRAEFMAQATRRAARGLVQSTGLDGIARYGAHKILCPLRKSLLRSRTVRELRRLDDRMLLDIGLTRGDVEAFAGTLVEKQLPAAPARPAFVARIKGWLDRNRTIRELEALEDRLLADIGLERSQIAAAVDRSLKGTPAPAMPRETVVDRTYAALRQWNLSRQAAKEMSKLGPDVLSDLGYVKGDVDWVPEVLARRRASRSQAA